jgi:hypothetical protein
VLSVVAGQLHQQVHTGSTALVTISITDVPSSALTNDNSETAVIRGCLTQHTHTASATVSGFQTHPRHVTQCVTHAAAALN